MDNRLRVCLMWWLSFIESYVPRPVPYSLECSPCVVSYSDGEGNMAGVGAALWCPGLPRPLAVCSEVPVVLRQYWLSAQPSKDRFNDIFLVEAVGPLLLLKTFPNILKACLWLHFIDNTAAEASLIRGASSKDHGDHVVGLTWSIVQQKLIWP